MRIVSTFEQYFKYEFRHSATYRQTRFYDPVNVCYDQNTKNIMFHRTFFENSKELCKSKHLKYEAVSKLQTFTMSIQSQINVLKSTGGP